LPAAATSALTSANQASLRSPCLPYCLTCTFGHPSTSTTGSTTTINITSTTTTSTTSPIIHLQKHSTVAS
jgi:hypothetical protein